MTEGGFETKSIFGERKASLAGGIGSRLFDGCAAENTQKSCCQYFINVYIPGEQLMESINRFRPESELLTEEGCYIVELRNVEEDPDCSIARARVQPGVETKLHCLRGTVERYVILEGVGEVEIGDEPPVSVARFDVVHISAGAPQRIRNIGSKDLIFLCICTPRFRADAYEKLEG